MAKSKNSKIKQRRVDDAINRFPELDGKHRSHKTYGHLMTLDKAVRRVTSRGGAPVPKTAAEMLHLCRLIYEFPLNNGTGPLAAVHTYFRLYCAMSDESRHMMVQRYLGAKGITYTDRAPHQPREPREPRAKPVYHGKRILNPVPARPTDYIKTRDAFYQSWDWRTVRMKTLQRHGYRCQCCGATGKDRDMLGQPVRIVVDHIKPLYTHWHLRLEEDNLQVLCDECNMGKGAWDETDHRPVALN